MAEKQATITDADGNRVTYRTQLGFGRRNRIASLLQRAANDPAAQIDAMNNVLLEIILSWGGPSLDGVALDAAGLDELPAELGDRVLKELNALLGGADPKESPAGDAGTRASASAT